MGRKILFNSAADRRYCSNCIYRISYTGGYICNFFVTTGERRKCNAGVGCIRKELDHVVKTKDSVEKSCERCGEKFFGSRKAHYCPECRKIRIRETTKEGDDS